MLSAVLEAEDAPVPLATSLASLVPGAVEGLVREVVLVDRGMGEAARHVADHAGCRIIAPAELAAALRDVKGDWLLIMEVGARLEPNWVEPVVSSLSAIPAGDTGYRFTPTEGGLRAVLAGLFRRRRALALGVLLRKADVVRQVEKGNDLAGAAARFRTRAISARMRPR